MTTGYSGKIELPWDFYVSGFADINIADKEGPTWGYGEVVFGKPFGKDSRYKVEVGAGLKSKGSGEINPRKDLRLIAGINF